MPRYESKTKQWINANRIEQVPTRVADGDIDNFVESVVAGTNVTVDNTDPQNPIVSSTGGGGGGVPTDWVEWAAVLDTGLVDGANHHVQWEDTLGNVSYGTAITLNGSGDADGAVEGWYTLDFYVLVDGETNGATWGDARLRTDITRGFSIGIDIQETVISLLEFLPNYGGFPQANLPFTWTGYLTVGDTVEVHARMARSSVGSDTFEIGDGQFRMEKLPMSAGGGGSGVTSVDGLTGVVNLSGSYDALGAATTVETNAEAYANSTAFLHTPADGIRTFPTPAGISLPIAESDVTNLVTDLASKQATTDYTQSLLLMGS